MPDFRCPFVLFHRTVLRDFELFSIVSLGRLWLNKTEEAPTPCLYMYRCSSLTFHMYNTRVNTHNEGNIAVNRNAFSTTGQSTRQIFESFCWQTFVSFQFVSTFQFQSKPLNLRKTFNRNANLLVFFSVSPYNVHVTSREGKMSQLIFGWNKSPGLLELTFREIIHSEQSSDDDKQLIFLTTHTHIDN